ncbi:hypothetical protein OH77DRAFT_1065679 [Trametes cingulata]|nr:hypothetical protein OH77DRAFT_1065679 [Trametes cingulata]
MEHPRVPIELCECIIDFCDDWQSRFDPARVRDLLSCALTCQDWLPRSRLHLYRAVRIRTRKQLDCFVATLALHPFLADFVEELVVGRASGSSATSEEKYLPFAQHALLSRLRRLKRLNICYFHWQAHQPRFHTLVAQYPIVKLELIGGYFRTMADLFRVVWSFVDLRVLRLVNIERPEKPGPPLEGLISKRPRLCAKLEVVRIVGHALLALAWFPPVGCFGTSLTKLKLTWAKELGDQPTEALLALVSALKCLQGITWSRSTLRHRKRRES